MEVTNGQVVFAERAVELTGTVDHLSLRLQGNEQSARKGVLSFLKHIGLNHVGGEPVVVGLHQLMRQFHLLRGVREDMTDLQFGFRKERIFATKSSRACGHCGAGGSQSDREFSSNPAWPPVVRRRAIDPYRLLSKLGASLMS